MGPTNMSGSPEDLAYLVDSIPDFLARLLVEDRDDAVLLDAPKGDGGRLFTLMALRAGRSWTSSSSQGWHVRRPMTAEAGQAWVD